MAKKEEKLYELRYSFAVWNEKNLTTLNELRQRFQDAGVGSLREFCKKLGKSVPNNLNEDDRIEQISVVRVNRGESPYGFFHIVTKTKNDAHMRFWQDLCMREYPQVIVAVIGSGSDGEQICMTLYRPNNTY